MSRLLGWRWTPCVAPVLGSLAFVGVCVAVVPDEIGSVSARTPRPVALGDRPTSRLEVAPAEERHSTSDDAPARASRRRSPKVAPAQRAPDVQSFFHAPQELPLPPPDPAPEAPPPPPPPPPPTATIFTLPDPASAPAAPAAASAPLDVPSSAAAPPEAPEAP